MKINGEKFLRIPGHSDVVEGCGFALEEIDAMLEYLGEEEAVDNVAAERIQALQKHSSDLEQFRKEIAYLQTTEDFSQINLEITVQRLMHIEDYLFDMYDVLVLGESGPAIAGCSIAYAAMQTELERRQEV